VAAYAGDLVERYLLEFERDPGDLQMLARLSELLEEGRVLAERDLLAVLRLTEGSPLSRMAARYQARWLHQRLRPFLSQIETDGAPADLTVEQIGNLLARLKE
jgi:hypothetical protein